MTDKPELAGIERDGIGIAKDLLEDPRLKNAIKRLKERIQRVVTSTGEKVQDPEAVATFEKAIISTVIDGLKKAVEKE